MRHEDRLKRAINHPRNETPMGVPPAPEISLPMDWSAKGYGERKHALIE